MPSNTYSINRTIRIVHFYWDLEGIMSNIIYLKEIISQLSKSLQDYHISMVSPPDLKRVGARRWARSLLRDESLMRQSLATSRLAHLVERDVSGSDVEWFFYHWVSAAAGVRTRSDVRAVLRLFQIAVGEHKRCCHINVLDWGCRARVPVVPVSGAGAAKGAVGLDGSPLP